VYLLLALGGGGIIRLYGMHLGTYVFTVSCVVYGQAAVCDCLCFGLPSEPGIGEYHVGDHGN
jgi:hypothetical protein